MFLQVHLLIVLLLAHCEAGLEWHPYISMLIQQHLKCPYQPVVISAPLPPPCQLTDLHPSVSCFLPDIIVWDPFHQFQHEIGSLQECHCFEQSCTLPLTCMRWLDASKPRYMPRSVYGLNGVVLIVAQILHCRNGHQVTTCDARILNKFSDRAYLPFILFHRSGLTRELSQLIFTQASLGTPFKDIEAVIRSCNVDRHFRSVLMYYTYISGKTELETTDVISPATTLPTSSSIHTISNDLIADCFIAKFKEMKNYFDENMCLKKGVTISCDHTFKFANHVGIKHEGKWVGQYDSLFIIQNELGEVLFWQLTKGTSYSVVEDGFDGLSKRLKAVSEQLEVVIIDNCCTWKKKLSSTFGNEIKIKLDLFHAVQRITKAVSKRNPHFYSFVQDLRLVFRKQGDCGPTRTKATPSPAIISSNLDVFCAKWAEISSAMLSNPVVTTCVQKEIDNLRKHIVLGCLSDIPPGFGTNRNENLHKYLNKRLCGQNIGVELAVALLTTYFFMWNSKSSTVSKDPTKLFNEMLCQQFKQCVQNGNPVKRSNETTSTYRFGIGVSKTREYCQDKLGSSFQNPFNSLQAIEEISTLTNLCKEKTKTDGTTATSTISIGNKCVVSHTDIQEVLLFALRLLNTENVLNRFSHTHPIQSRISVNPQHHEEMSDVFSENAELHRLTSVLLSYNLESLAVDEDGDCLFHAVCLHLANEITADEDTSDLLSHAQSLGYSIQSDAMSKVLLLRKLVVKEWLDNQSTYKPFFLLKDFQSAAREFVQSGVFAGDLGDAMVLAISNVLQVPIVVFSSVENYPCIPIHPRRCSPSAKPILLGFLQNYKGGHYCLVVPKQMILVEESGPKVLSLSSNTTTKGCRCGRGRNSKDGERINCSTTTTYLSRCSCLRSQVKCTVNCKCLNCNNKKPKVPTLDITNPESRKRRARHPEQDSKRMSGIKYIKIEGEQPHTGHWTPIEHYVFQSIIHVLGQVTESDLITDISTLQKLYSATVDFVLANSLSLPLSRKNEQQIKGKVQDYTNKQDKMKVTGMVCYPHTS